MIRWLIIVFFSVSAVKAQEQIIYLNNGHALRINNGIEILDTAFGSENLALKTYITNPVTGLLQFYSDGVKIWDANHKQLKSNYRLPGCTNVFITNKNKLEDSYYLVSIASGELYAFTISKVGSDYEVTDSVRLAYGIPLNENGSLEMIRACDGNSFWIIIGAPGLDAKIHAFYATKDSVFSRPVTSPLRFRSSVYGLQFKCSPDGKYMAAIYSNGSGMVDVYRFDRKCGSFTFEKAGYFKYYVSQHHGMAFSHDSRYLFVSRNHHDVSSTNSVIRFDMNSPNLDSNSFRWDLSTGELIAKVTTVNNSVYVLWFESQRTYWKVWLDKIVDYHDTASTIIPHYQETGLLYNFPNVQEPKEVNCFPDSSLHLNIDFRCVDDLITISNFNISSFADSVLLYYGDSLIHFTDSFQILATKTGSLRLRLEAYNCGFPAIAERVIFIPPKPKIFPNTDTIICAVNSGYLIGGLSIFNHFWSNGSMTSTDTFFTVKKSGKYVVRQSFGSCIALDTFEVTFHPTIEPPLDEKYIICKDLEEKLRIELPDNMLDYQLNGMSTGRDIAFADTGIYLVKLIDHNKCEIQDTLTIANQCPYYILFPNSFTPNGDGLNDVFKAQSEHLMEFNLTLYDRWGKKIFESSDPALGWDGKIKGELAESGVFIYHCSFSYEEGNAIRKKSIKGTVNLFL